MDKFVTRKRKSDAACVTADVHENGKRSKIKSNDVDETKKCQKLVTFSKLSAKNLDCDYGLIFTRDEARELFLECEREISYFTGQLSKVFVFGKWHDIPRKQVRMKEGEMTLGALWSRTERKQQNSHLIIEFTTSWGVSE